MELPVQSLQTKPPRLYNLGRFRTPPGLPGPVLLGGCQVLFLLEKLDHSLHLLPGLDDFQVFPVGFLLLLVQPL